MDLRIVNNNKAIKKLAEGIAIFTKLSVCIFLIIFLLRFFELVQHYLNYSITNNIYKISGYGFFYDVLFWCKLSGWLMFFFIPVYFISRRVAITSIMLVAIIFFLLNTILIQYFKTALVPLGADVYGYSVSDIQLTVGTGGGVKAPVIVSFVGLTVFLIVSLIIIMKKVHVRPFAYLILAPVFVMVMAFNLLPKVARPALGSEYMNDLTLNKANFFVDESYSHFFPVVNEVDIYAEDYLGAPETNNDSLYTLQYVDEGNYPFLHTDQTPDVLSGFINKTDKLPNIVIILVEGLGRAFTNESAELGSFTPFLDSLSRHSLYWENFLSAGGRTFAVLPAFLGSLPFGENGFLALGDQMPQHLSLLTLLKYNGYRSAFYYGGNADFDNMNIFFKKNNANAVYDESTFSNQYVKMPLSQNGYTWGFGDKELYRHYFEINNSVLSTQPYLSVILTVSSHFPFLINEQEKYLQSVRDRLEYLNFDDNEKASHLIDANAYASIMFTDDALKAFFDGYSKRDDFDNTIFLITGDHRIPEIPMSTKLDRFHVPFMIYSPLLKRSAKFSSISTHFDVTPTILAFLKSNYNLQLPTYVSWLGTGIDTAKPLLNKHAYALKQSKSEEIDFVMQNYQLHNTTLFRIGANLNIAPEENVQASSLLTTTFNTYKQRNSKFINGAKLVPDSIYNKYVIK